MEVNDERRPTNDIETPNGRMSLASVGMMESATWRLASVHIRGGQCNLQEREIGNPCLTKLIGISLDDVPKNFGRIVHLTERDVLDAPHSKGCCRHLERRVEDLVNG